MFQAEGALRRFSSQEIKKFVEEPIFDEKIFLARDLSWPKISIVTPSYNQGEFLEETILSVLNQKYPNLEYIIIDGESTDESVEIIRKYQKYIAHWVSEPDGGQADGINKGFRVATGDLVAWQNSDDIYLPGAFEKVAHAYEKNGDAAVFFGNTYLIDKVSNILKEMRFIPFSLDHLLFYDWNLSSQAVFWRRELFDHVGMLEDSYHVSFDWDWFIRLGKADLTFTFIREFLGAYRIHEASKFTLIPREEREEIRQEILRKNGIEIEDDESLSLMRRKIFFRRVKHYVRQGDFGYLFDGILRRMDKDRRI